MRFKQLFFKKKVSILRVVIIVFFFVFLLILGHFIIKMMVLDRLKRIDQTASFSSINYGFNSLVITNFNMSRKQLYADKVYVLLENDVFHYSPVHVVLDGCSYVFSTSESQSASTSIPVSLPTISVLSGFLPDYNSTFNGTQYNEASFFTINGEWGEAFGRIQDDAVTIAFSNCSEIPLSSFEDAFPSEIRGHSFSGLLHGEVKEPIAVEGIITSIDDKPVLLNFEYSDEDSLPLVNLSMDFSLIEQSFSLILDSITKGSVLGIAPSGSLFISLNKMDSISFRTDLLLDSILLFNSAISADTILMSVSLLLNGCFKADSYQIIVDSGTVSSGNALLNFDLNYCWGERHKLILDVFNDSLLGEALIASIPAELLGRLYQLELTGNLSVFIQLVLDWDYPDSSDIHFDINTENLSVGYSPITFGSIKNYRGATCRMRDSWGNIAIIGLDTLTNSDFVFFDSLPFYFEPLLRCAEDAGFRRHHGFSEYHIRNSIRADIESGSFVRGGSTISMQLAKNLFLSREKTLARKIQEVFLTWRIEHWLSKNRILEIYANIVELGPGIFGFNSAAIYYFNEPVGEISVKEMAFLISILPGPKLYHKFAVNGELPYYWDSYVERLITISGNRGWLEQSVVSAATADTLIFDGRVSLL